MNCPNCGGLLEDDCYDDIFQWLCDECCDMKLKFCRED